MSEISPTFCFGRKGYKKYHFPPCFPEFYMLQCSCKFQLFSALKHFVENRKEVGAMTPKRFKADGGEGVFLARLGLKNAGTAGQVTSASAHGAGRKDSIC